MDKIIFRTTELLEFNTIGIAPIIGAAVPKLTNKSLTEESLDIIEKDLSHNIPSAQTSGNHIGLNIKNIASIVLKKAIPSDLDLPKK